MVLVVGAHPQNLSLSLLSRRRDKVESLREAGLEFFIYEAGSQTIPLLKAGVLHLAGTGATPPILAEAQGLPSAVFRILRVPPRKRRPSGACGFGHSFAARSAAPGCRTDADILAHSVSC